MTSGEVYRILRKTCGPCGWWPLMNRKTMKSEYRGTPPKNDRELFEIALGAILTQNIAWTNVEKCLVALHQKKLLAPRALDDADRETIASCIRPSGYFNQKTIKIKSFLEWLKSRRYSMTRCSSLSDSELRTELLAIKGVGPETADSIMLYGYGRKIFVVDAYTRRVFSRLGFFSASLSYNEMQKFFHHHFRGTVDDYKEFHACIVMHGKDICKTRPLCGQCVLAKTCRGRVGSPDQSSE
jgi:endonuclease III related protein